MQTVCNTYRDAGKGNLTAQNTRKPFGGDPDPAGGAYSAPANPLSGGEGLAAPSPRTISPGSRPFGPRLSFPHSKISSNPVGYNNDSTTTGPDACTTVYQRSLTGNLSSRKISGKWASAGTRLKRLRRTGGAGGIVTPNASSTPDEPGTRN